MSLAALFTFVRRPSFFVSYAREEAPIVQPIVQILRAAGRKVFFDQDSIRPGSDWRNALQDAIEKATGMFLFWSRNAAESPAVRREWQAALDGRKAVVPVLLDHTQLPPELRRYQWIDARGARLDLDSKQLTVVDRQVGAQVARSNIRVAVNYLVLALAVGLSTWFLNRPSFQQVAMRQISQALSNVTFSRMDDETKMERDPVFKTALARSGIRYFLDSGTASLEQLSRGDRDHLLITVRLRGSYHEEHFRGIPGDLNNMIAHRHEPTGLVDLAFKRVQSGWELESSAPHDFKAEARAQRMMLEAGLPKVKEAIVSAIRDE